MAVQVYEKLFLFEIELKSGARQIGGMPNLNQLSRRPLARRVAPLPEGEEWPFDFPCLPEVVQ